MANQTKPHRYLVVVDIESPLALDERDLADAFTEQHWSLPQLPCEIVAIGTVVSSTNSPARRLPLG